LAKPPVVVALVVAGLLSTATPSFGAAAYQAQAAPQSTPTDAPAAAPLPKPPERFEIRASDGSVLKARLLDEKIPLKTEFGTLEIPAAGIHRIEFATRIPDEVQQRVMAAIEKLGHAEYKLREEATAELVSLGAAAHAALMTAAKSDDAEVARRAELLLEELRKTAPEEQLQQRSEDTVYTDKSQIAGTIALEALRIETELFGPQQVKVALLRRLSLGSEGDAEAGDVLPDPGTLANYRNQIGRTLRFRVTAPAQGVQLAAVWGTDVYTYDSHLSMAAVHAGVIAPGQTKVLEVTILGPQPGFGGSTRNGVTSGNWGQYPSAFTFQKVRNAAGQRLRIQAVPAGR
jgi:hypothetical protein